MYPLRKIIKNIVFSVIKFLSINLSFFYRVLYLLPYKKKIVVKNLVNNSSSKTNYFSYLYINFFLLVSRYSKSQINIEKKVVYSLNKEHFIFILNVNENTQCSFFFNLPNPELVNVILKGGNTFLDIGANVGFFSILASRYFDKVVSFEPTRKSIESFKKNISSNNINNISLMEYGLSDKEGQMTLNINPLNAGGNSFEKLDNEMVKSSGRDDWNSYQVSVSTLDKFIFNNGFKRIELIKVDVESHEPYVIRGAIKTLEYFKPLVYIEIAGQRSFLNKILQEMPEFYEPFNPLTMTRINKNEELPWDVLFVPNEKDKTLL